MRKRALPLLIMLLAGTVRCGGGGADSGIVGTTDNVSTTNGTFTAQINGWTWNALGKASVTKNASNLLVFAGVGPIGSVTYSVSLALGGVTAPGTYSLAYANSSGSQMIVGNSSSSGWGTYFAGGTGTVTITTLTANHIAGTFSADAMPATSPASGTLQVRNGKVDLTF